MPIYPALDIIDGGCVRLRQGDFARQTRYSAEPLEQARRYQQAGAQWLHLVDLDGARSDQPQCLSLVRELAKSGLNIQTGGGVRHADHIESLLQAGAARVVIGSLAVTQAHQVAEWLKAFGSERVTLALDVRVDDQGLPKVATRAWRDTSDQDLWSLLDDYRTSGLKHVLCTDIGRDGEMQGPALGLYTEAIRLFPGIQWQASGGVNSLGAIGALKKIPVAGVIIGKALLEGVFDIQEAVACWQND